MPIYEYRCTACGKEFEVIQKSTDTAERLSCPSCGKDKLEKILSSCHGTSSSKSGASPAPSSCGGGRFS